MHEDNQVAQLQHQIANQRQQQQSASSELTTLQQQCVELERTRQSECDQVRQRRVQQLQQEQALAQTKQKLMGKIGLLILSLPSLASKL